jgi:hypothetical protein
MDGMAPGRPAVRTQRRLAARWTAPSALAVTVVAGRMHGAEARCRQRREHERMSPDRLGNALPAAGRARVQELPHVTRVLPRARRADSRAAVAAPDHQHAIRLVVSRVRRAAAAGRLVHDLAAEPNRARSVPAASELLGPTLEVRPAGTADDLVDYGRRQLDGPGHAAPASRWRRAAYRASALTSSSDRNAALIRRGMPPSAMSQPTPRAAGSMSAAL